MKDLIFSILLILLSFNSFASFNCEADFPETYHGFNVLRKSQDISFVLDNWDNISVIRDFDKEYCYDLVDMELVKVNSNFFWMITTIDDGCDGGNTYGVIYNYGLSEAVAGIFDGDVECF